LLRLSQLVQHPKKGNDPNANSSQYGKENILFERPLAVCRCHVTARYHNADASDDEKQTLLVSPLPCVQLLQGSQYAIPQFPRGSSKPPRAACRAATPHPCRFRQPDCAVDRC
jgi:hypothetical protein